MSDYTELKRLAEAATPGPWKCSKGYEQEEGAEGCYIEAPSLSKIFICHEQVSLTDPDYEFIAAANPAAILALIAEIEQLKRDVSAGNAREWDLKSQARAAKESRARIVELNKSLSSDRDMFIADKKSLLAAYNVALEIDHELRVERSALREAVKFAARTFKTITSSDGSGHADLAVAVLRIAGAAMGGEEES